VFQPQEAATTQQNPPKILAKMRYAPRRILSITAPDMMEAVVMANKVKANKKTPVM
jgi:hypothetical protein